MNYLIRELYIAKRRNTKITHGRPKIHHIRRRENLKKIKF